MQRHFDVIFMYDCCLGNFELVWLRYVDDVVAVLSDNINLDNFHVSLDRLSPIKFTIEKESNNSTPLLDVQLIRGENNRP